MTLATASDASVDEREEKEGKKGAAAPGWRSPFIPPHVGGLGRGPVRWSGIHQFSKSKKILNFKEG
jgi:hypothetical protein